MVNERLKSYGVLVAVFALGAAAGAGGMHAWGQHRYARDALHFGVSDQRRMRALSDALGLDRDQQDKVRAIFEKHRDRRWELQKKMIDECGKPLEADRSLFNSEIRAVLRPDQQKKWDELLARRHGHGPFGGPRPHPSAP